MSGAIRLAADDLEIEIWPLGARLNGLWFRGIGSLVDGASDRAEALGPKKFNGAVVGPVANRIAGGSATIDGRSCVFDKNQGGIITLHSGASGVHALDWALTAQDAGSLSLGLDLEDGQGGFPGNRALRVEYRLHGPEMQVNFSATSDAPTWINMALHPYWRFGKAGRAGSQLSVCADGYLPVDDDKIPTGAVAQVEGTEFDLRRLAPPSHGIDHNFCLDAQPPEVAARLEGDLGVGMDIITNAPGLQIYSGKEIGIAVEPQHWPDAMHFDHFPSVELRPGQTYSQSTTYRFSKL